MIKGDIDIKYIVDIIQNVLNDVHVVEEKKKIDVDLNKHKPQISFACPICGDSVKNMYLKRGHLYLNNFFYKCYNDETCSSSFTRFCKRFGVKINPEQKLLIYNHIDNNYKFQPKDDYTNILLNKLININDYIDYCNSGKNKLYDVKPITFGTPQYFYLKDRYVMDFNNIYQGTLKMTEKWNEYVIVIMNRSEDKLLGVNLRNLKEDKAKRIYKILDFEYIYNQLCIGKDCETDDSEIYTYNKISNIYNILNVSYDLPIHVFEGYLDSIFFPNSVSSSGKSGNIDILLNNDLNLKFIYDNDKGGIDKAINMIDKGYSVFLWKKLLKDIGIKHKFIKDINDLVIHYGNDNIYRDLKLDRYFSIDQFDKIWL
jgi:hypothetical protein